MKIFLKYLKPFALLVALAMALLVAQAAADLAMPNLMSDIVNVGLQGGGIAESVPKTLTPEGMAFLTSFMTLEDADFFRRAYEGGGDGLYEALEFNDTADGRRADIYNRTMFFFVQKAMGMIGQMGLPQGGQVSGGQTQGEPRLADIEPAMVFQMGQMLVMAPNLRDELRAFAATDLDSQIAAQAGKAMIPLFYRDAGLDTVKIQRDYIYRTGAMMMLLTLGTALSAVCVGLLSARTAAGFSRNLRRAVFTKVQNFSKAEIDKFSIASLITRSTNDVQHVQMFILMGIRMMVFAPIMGVGGTVMAIRKALNLSWILIVALGLMICALILVLIIVMPRFKVLQKLIDKLNLVSRENLTGLMVVRAFGNEAHEEARFEAAAHDLAKTERFLNRSMALLMPMMMLLMNGLSMMVVWFGGRAIENASLQIGDLMAFIQYAMNIVFSFVFVGMMFVMLPRAMVSAGRVREVLETDITVNDLPEAKTIPAGPVRVEFRNVDFRYAGAEEDVLSDISFIAKPGETTAFIGATGAGKSTLVNLIERFYDVTGGGILFNGVDIRDVPQAQLRAKIGFVPQSAVLFSGDIRSNVNYDETHPITDEAVFEALKTAQAEDFVSEMEEGLEAHVAQGGVNFSGGQKQRLSIARALAPRPGVYIFDDSFSALDYVTDHALRRALKQRTADATVFIVAQRVSTILHAEQIVVLDEGKIVGMGTHRELLQSCEVYREIAESQLNKEELE